MASLITSNVQDNEIVKAVDFNNGFDATINNVAKLAESIFTQGQDFVIGGKITPINNTWTVNIAPIFGVCNSASLDTYKHIPFCNTELTPNVAVNPGDTTGGDKYGIIEVRGSYRTFNTQQRAFFDPDTETTSYQDVNTQKELYAEFKVSFGNADVVIAPDKTDGWVKLAEIYAPQNAQSISQCTIYNVTADVAGDANTGWTNDTTATYDVGYISDVNARFRQQHNENGTHKANVIGASNIKIGVDTDNVNGSNVPVGTVITVDGTAKASTDSIATLIALVASKISTVFSDYYNKGGKYNLNGEVKVSDLFDSQNNALTNALKIGAAGDGTAYLKIGNTVMLNITADGRLQTSGQAATSNNDIVTKSVTDGIASDVSDLDGKLDDFIEEVGDISSYANSLLSRYTPSSASIQAISTTNYSLTGLQTIDTVVTSDGYHVLLKDQTNPEENGIWIVHQGAWTRDSNMNSAAFYRYKFFTATAGSANKNKLFYCPDILDTYAPGVTELNFLEANISVAKAANKVPMRDSSGKIYADLNGNVTGNVTGNVSGNAGGNATSADKVNKKLSIQLNGGTSTEFDGSAAKSINITPSGIGAAASSHTHLYAGASSSGGAATSAEALTAAGEIAFMKKVYPVGSLFISKVANNPQDWYAAGTWTWRRITDSCTIRAAASSDTVDDTVRGSDTVTLGTSNIPQHRHSFTPSGDISGGSYSFSGTKQTGSAGVFMCRDRTRSGVFSSFTEAGGRTYDGYEASAGYSGTLNFSMTPSGTISVSTNPTFTGTASNTGYAGQATPTALNIKNKYLARYMYERTA